ncbi:DoxX family protein [Sandaracinus amylolyticus]|uniref:DoxX family protein n=1 Tax=Sandaracinus amylolyticus TaxID=927083 RepID=UPI001F28C82C|nr:DoxX family protein [Sandaracinus amylolyticus]UJR85264.1 Hypothetical protein I5071_73440 [Sandaracinus amylolyticus]
MSDRIRRYAPHAARILLGLLFFVFGLNGFLQFIPQPPPPPEAGAFLGGLAAAGYMFPLIKGTEVVAGALLLTNRFVPLALVLLAPIVVNIVFFHAVLAPDGIGMVLFILALEVGLAFAYRSAFREVLALDAKPTPQPAANGEQERRAVATA